MKKRDSRFELVRIISMIMIVAYHYTMYGNWSREGFNTIKIQFFRPWGQVGVALFVMITGYFLVNRESDLNKSWQRVKRIWIKTLIYSWIILLCAFVFHFGSFYKRDFLYAFFPVIFDEYWFITSYIVLILLTPVLNIAVEKLSKRDLLRGVVVIIVFADIVPFIKNDGTPNAPLGNMFSVGAMLAPYLIAGYVKKYKIKIKTWQAGIMAIVGIVLEYLSLIILKHGIMGLDIASFTFGLLPLIAAFGIFMLFLNLKEFYSRWINWLASGVLASYLITEHPLFRIFFWQKLLNVGRFETPTWLFIAMGLLIAVVTVISCSILDQMYNFVSQKLNRKK